jgi:hypothetical protein
MSLHNPVGDTRNSVHPSSEASRLARTSYGTRVSPKPYGAATGAAAAMPMRDRNFSKTLQVENRIFSSPTMKQREHDR